MVLSPSGLLEESYVRSDDEHSFYVGAQDTSSPIPEGPILPPELVALGADVPSVDAPAIGESFLSSLVQEQVVLPSSIWETRAQLAEAALPEGRQAAWNGVSTCCNVES